MVNGVGMMNMASGGMIGGTAQAPFQQQGNQAQTPVDPYAKTPVQTAEPAKEGVKCPNCGAIITGKFCAECGTKMPEPEPVKEEPTKKFCTNCGAEVTGKFCTECGTAAE